MLDLFLAGACLVLLLGAVVALARLERRDPGRTAVLVAVIVVAAGGFAVGLYRVLSEPAGTSPPAPAAAVTGPVSQGFGTAVTRVEVPMGTGDKLPQGALVLDPPRPGPDAYTGDVSLLCYTPGKSDHDQNCSGGDKRTWTIEPLAKHAVLAPATGDPFADPGACSTTNGVAYQEKYLELAAGRSYCLRPAGRSAPTVALRIPAFPAERPLPAKLIVETAVLSS
jgi:hypothetical protein